MKKWAATVQITIRQKWKKSILIRSSELRYRQELYDASCKVLNALHDIERVFGMMPFTTFRGDRGDNPQLKRTR
jgi:hypothetical protein